MPFTLEHKSLGTTLNGVELPSAIQFRGIPYGSVPARFEKPEPLAKLPATLDCTLYGLAPTMVDVHLHCDPMKLTR